MLMPQKPRYSLRLISPVSLLLITALACHNTAEAQVQMQSLSVLRDTISTDVTVHQKGIVNNVLDVLQGNAAGVTLPQMAWIVWLSLALCVCAVPPQLLVETIPLLSSMV